jgi:hypothetical protein
VQRANPYELACLEAAGVDVHTTGVEGGGGVVPLKLVDFCGSIKRLAWAAANGCPWWGGCTS